MTIRLRCAACQRKLKVPDEALGKKIQCPACGARFRGQIEPEPPRSRPEAETTFPPVGEASTQAAPQLDVPPVEQPLAETIALTPEEAPAPEVPLDEAPLVDTLFAEMASHPLPDVALPPESPRKTTPAASPFVNLELDEPPVEAEPAASELDEMVVLGDSNATEPIMLGGTEAALEDEPVEIVDDVEEEEVTTTTPARKPKRSAKPSHEEPEVAEDEDEPAQGDKPPKAKKSRKKLVLGCLAGILGVGLIVCGGGGFIGYRFFTGAIADGDWKTFAPPEGGVSVSMPGEPVASSETQSGMKMSKYLVEKKWAYSDFVLLTFELPFGGMAPTLLDKMIDEESKNLSNKLKATQVSKRSITLGRHQGREALLQLAGGRNAIVRIYVVTSGAKSRVYELAASGPKLEASSGAGGKFFSSFTILEPSPAQPTTGANPPPVVNPPSVVLGNLFPDSEWKQINPPGSRCGFQMPGYPKQIKEPDDPAIHFQLERQPQGCVFEVAYFDMPVGQNPMAFLNETMAGVEKQMLGSTGGKVAQKGTVNRPRAQGRQLVITGPKGETYITQLYVTTGKDNRVYQLMVQGAKIQSGRGDSLKFLNSFKINR